MTWVMKVFKILKNRGTDQKITISGLRVGISVVNYHSHEALCCRCASVTLMQGVALQELVKLRVAIRTRQHGLSSTRKFESL